MKTWLIIKAFGYIVATGGPYPGTVTDCEESLWLLDNPAPEIIPMDYSCAASESRPSLETLPPAEHKIIADWVAKKRFI
jgi:hypothetical protein